MAEVVFKMLFQCNDIWVMVISDNVFVAFRFYTFRFCNKIYIALPLPTNQVNGSTLRKFVIDKINDKIFAIEHLF